MRIGSDAHKELLCRRFHEAHLAYEPADLSWPDLDAEHLQKLRAIPFWEEALANEVDAGNLIHSLTEVLDDPILRDAVALQGFEESRHARILRHLIDRYQLEVAEPEPEAIPAHPERAFVGFGYSECLDSFGAFGIFALARRMRYFPEPLFEVFDRILDEEAQHTVFFVNWVAHSRARLPGWRAWTAVRGYGAALGRLHELYRSSEDSQESFTTAGAGSFIDELDPADYVATCISESRRRMDRIDPDLLRPKLLPSLARFGLPLIRALGGRRRGDAAGGGQAAPA